MYLRCVKPGVQDHAGAHNAKFSVHPIGDNMYQDIKHMFCVLKRRRIL